MICPTCYRTYAADATTCAEDKTTLVPDETFAHVDKELAPGTAVGEYRVEAKIGAGGFGAVYRAVHPLIGKTAAVKILSRQFSTSAQTVSRFIAEARAVNQIGHRNIIDIFSFGRLPDGRQYYIMELLEGSTFDGYLAKRGRLSVAEAVPILRGIARALDAAHAKGILHRDLKPENVFLVSDDDGRIQPKLLDFGLVKLLDGPALGEHKTKTGTPMGTPYYMSPEQCRGLDVDPRTDVYSFGAMVFELLTGEVPFQGGSPMDILMKHMSSPPPRASALAPELSAEVDAVIARMMAKDPADRPARVGEAVDLLARAAGLDAGAGAGAGARVVAPSTPPSLTLSPESQLATTLVGDPRAAAASPVRLVTPTTEPAPSTTPPKAAAGATFLDSETDVREPARRSRSRWTLPLVACAVACAAVVGTIGYRARPPPASGGLQAATTEAPSGRAPDRPAVEPRPSPAPTGPADRAPASAASVREVSLRVDAPPGTVVSADGVELGKAPGPFKLRAGVPVRLAFSSKGYKPKETILTPEEDIQLPVSLDRTLAAVGGARKPAAATAPSAIPSALESFDK